MITKRFVGRHLGRMAVWVVTVAAMVMFTMATALSVSDFLRLLFADEGGAAVAAPQASSSFLQGWLDMLYGYLLSFGKMKAIVLFALLVLVLYGCKAMLSYASAVEIGVLRFKVCRDIRNAMYKRVLRLPMGYYAKSRKGDVLARFGGDLVEYDESVLGSLQLLISSVVSVALYVGMLLCISVRLTLFVLCMLPIIMFVIARLGRKLKRQSRRLQDDNSVLMSLIEETIMGLKVIKAYTAIEFCNSRFKERSEAFTRLRMKVFRRVDLASPLSEVLNSIVVICILLYGSHLVLGGVGGLSAELFVSYIAMFILIIEPSKNLTTAVSQIKKGKACAERLEQLVECEEEPEAVECAECVVDEAAPMVEFSHVCFAYCDDGGRLQRVLDDVCLAVPRGRCVAIVGSSGSGKSTMADLVSRMYDATSGSVLVGGVDVRKMGLHQLRGMIGVVAQDTVLFNDTVYGNIAFGRPGASREEVEAAARVACAHDFIMALPQGYDTNIGDGGSLLSGGQRQRISIARAVLCNPDILILDEATSALDTENERQVQMALDSVMAHRTSIVIAHRLSTVVNADEIVVLEQGRIVERGKHAELMAARGRYWQLASMQAE